MKNHITDEKAGIGYTLQGDYYLPDLALPAEEEQPIGIWGCGSPVATSAAGRSTVLRSRSGRPCARSTGTQDPSRQARPGR